MLHSSNHALYAISADPITLGHINIVRRAAKNFAQVTVAICQNPTKKYLLSVQERHELSARALASIQNARVTVVPGIPADYACEQGIDVIVKGVRGSADFDYEYMLHQVGLSQQLGIDTYLLFADTRLSHISSSAAKALQAENGFIHEYVPLNVKFTLEQKISGQTLIGVTGGIASGKTTFCNELTAQAHKLSITIHHICLDTLAHQILEQATQPYYATIRRNIAEQFGADVCSNGFINRKILGQRVFSSPRQRQKLNRIMYQPLMLRLKRELRDKQGVVLLNSALLTEGDMLKLCNNHIIHINTTPDTQRERLEARGYDRTQISQRLASQLDDNCRRQCIMEQIQEHCFGRLWEYEQTYSDDVSGFFSRILQQLTQELPGQSRGGNIAHAAD